MASASASGFNSISNNQARFGGGAICAHPNGNRSLVISLIGASGNPGNPIQLINNTAPRGAGIYFHFDGGNTVAAQLTNTIWVGQAATQEGAAAVVHMTGSGTKRLNIEGQSGCRYVFFGIEGCSAFYANASSAGPGVIGAFWNDEVSVLRSRFEGNSGVGAIFSSLGGDFRGEALIVRNHTGLPPVGYVPPRMVFPLPVSRLPIRCCALTCRRVTIHPRCSPIGSSLTDPEFSASPWVPAAARGSIRAAAGTAKAKSTVPWIRRRHGSARS